MVDFFYYWTRWRGRDVGLRSWVTDMVGPCTCRSERDPIGRKGVQRVSVCPPNYTTTEKFVLKKNSDQFTSPLFPPSNLVPQTRHYLTR